VTPRPIRAIVLDVDGVLTDGSFWWGPNGEEYKRFHFLDVMGISRAQRSGMLFALMSGEESALVGRLARKLGISDVFTGCKDKASALQEFARQRTLQLADVCFMGDDVNDLPAMSLAGVSAAPTNAHFTVKAQANIITEREGGNGAVRELIDRLVQQDRMTISYESTTPTR
jgi:3-deoxy-D-manno-octulosonate 8-phosphate phosphatase (KDO 8-P phosphatase)